MEHARGGSGRTFQAAGAALCSCQPSIGNAICEHAAAAMGWRRGAGSGGGRGRRGGSSGNTELLLKTQHTTGSNNET